MTDLARTIAELRRLYEAWLYADGEKDEAAARDAFLGAIGPGPWDELLDAAEAGLRARGEPPSAVAVAAELSRTKLERFRARITELEAQLAPRSNVMTHAGGCWRWHGHQACAVARIEDLEREEKILRAATLKDVSHDR